MFPPLQASHRACTCSDKLGRRYDGLGPRSHMYQHENPLARACVLVHTMRVEEPRPWYAARDDCTLGQSRPLTGTDPHDYAGRA